MKLTHWQFSMHNINTVFLLPNILLNRASYQWLRFIKACSSNASVNLLEFPHIVYYWLA